MSIKVLVVDDSAFMRKVIVDMLSTDVDIEVIDIAGDGQTALEKIKELNPDVVTLDIEMPVMDGLDCLEQIMLSVPTPVIMLSNLTRKDTDATIKALELGAIDFVAKPENIFDIATEAMKMDIIKKVKVAAKTKRKIYIRDIKINEQVTIPPGQELNYIVAIGTSTGGPRALEEVITSIPKNIPAAIVVVQHMPPGFTKSLAARLNMMSELFVKEAEDGDELRTGYVYIAPGDYHMTFNKGTDNNSLVIKLNQDKPTNRHRPSVDVMMNSLSVAWCKNIIGVIMTGMGSDGCEGLKNLKNKNNASIIAQNEDSSIVFGMPKAAIKAGIVDKIVPLKNITNEILKFMGVC